MLDLLSQKSRLTRKIVWAVAIAFVVALAVMAPASDAAAYKKCKNVQYDAGGYGVLHSASLKAKGTSCSRARAIARKVMRCFEGCESLPRPQGYKCRYSGPMRIVCTKGSRKIKWRQYWER